jgi:hypothetical protein
MSENINNLKFDLVSAHIRSVHPDWSADRVFTESLEVSGHTGGFGRDAGAEIMAGDVSFTRKKPEPKEGQHPMLVEELSKHWQLGEQRKRWAISDHVNRWRRSGNSWKQIRRFRLMQLLPESCRRKTLCRLRSRQRSLRIMGMGS